MRLSLRLICGLALASAAPMLSMLPAQAAQSPAAANRVSGEVTAIDGKSLTIKLPAGGTTTIAVGDSARVLRAAPGAKLNTATPIQLSDVAVGDRVLAIVAPAADGSAATATTLIAMKQSDIAEKQKADEEDWQRRGVGGPVKAVDPAAGTVTIASGARTLVIHVAAKTMVRRYDPESIKFSDAKPSSLDQIHAGDQLRARGERSADGSEITAEEIVAGSFRNIAGTVVSVDSAANTVTVTDLATKKPVVIHVTADSQMHKLPPMMAQGLAARLKNAGANSNGSPVPAAAPPSGATAGTGQGGGNGAGGQRSGDLSQMLQRAPAVQLSELHKGDAVMIVATQGTPDAATAVTLLAGVEPILTASPAASQSMFSASWNGLGGGAAVEAGTP